MLFSVALLAIPVAAEAQEVIIRVGLSTGTRFEVEICCGAYEVVDLATGNVQFRAQQGSRWVVALSPLGAVEVAKYGEGPPLAVSGPVLFRRLPSAGSAPLFSFGGRRYRGDLKVEKRAEPVLVAVNLVELEEYLYGVVGEEMGYSAPPEALKAQAVASRTYALARRASQAASAYDVTTGQDTQVYVGFEAETKPGFERVKSAVDATRGLVMYYQGRLIEAYFHSNAGGHTENSENVWQVAQPYLRGVPSPWDEYAWRISQDPQGWPAYTYQWTKTLTREELMKRVADWNAARTGKPEQQINVGEIIDLVPWRLGASGTPTVSGRITKLIIRGRNAQVELRGEQARSLLGLRSTLFEMSFDSQAFVLTGRGTLAESRVTEGWLAASRDGAAPANGNGTTYWVLGAGGVRRLPKVFTMVEFRGKGYGHGVGMSQWGARGMAAQGASFRDILEHYYNQGRKDGGLKIAAYSGG